MSEPHQPYTNSSAELGKINARDLDNHAKRTIEHLELQPPMD